MKIATATLLVTLAVPAFAADHYVRPHVDRNGNLTEGHMQTNPNSSRMDNYGTQGNANPYTGQAGTVNPYTTPTPTLNPYDVPRNRK